MPKFFRISQPRHSGQFQLRIQDGQITIACLVIFLIALWPLTHRYRGLAGDAALYAVQALAKIHPGLASDLFLQNNSQDNYTVFPLFYAWCIHWLGLRDAAMAMVIALKIWFFTMAWALTKVIFDRRSAFLSTAMVMVIVGSYGGYSVFNYSEDWLTARTLAEPLVTTAVWLFYRDFKPSAFLVATAAMFVHPLMALPGLALLLLLLLPFAAGAAGIALGVTATLATSLLMMYHPLNHGALSVMDADWLEVVRERSVFLFPQLWPAKDWAMNALPFVSLAISSLVLHDPRVHKLSIAVSLIGVAGLLIALIAAELGPVGFILQGQAWRWIWITRFAAVIVLAPTLLNLWREGKFGPLGALLAFVGWSSSPAIGLACMTVTLVLWWTGNRVTDRGAGYIRWISVAAAGVVIAWAVSHLWTAVSSSPRRSDLEPILVTNPGNIFALAVLSMTLAWSLAYCVEKTASRALLATISMALLTCGLLLYRGAFGVRVHEGSAEQIAEFSDWRRAMAPDDTVFVLPAHNSAAFAWFTLERPSYLTVDQSAGVVFSQATALETRRRSDVLLPLMYPNWKLLSESASSRPGTGAASKNEAKVLTKESLIRICADPKLKFVVARENLGFDPLPHTHDGNWKDWNLYDCRRVLSGTPPA